MGAALPVLVRIADDGPLRNFDFKEKAEVDKYYPQYYHKTDKVRWLAAGACAHSG